MRRPPAVLAAVLAGLPAAAPAGAHVVYGRPSLSELVGGADLVARARILDPAAAVAGEKGERRPAVTAELLEVFRGEAAPGPVRFAQHGHGVAVYERGEEVLLFLRAIERSRELAALATATDLQWISLQEHDAKFALGDGSRTIFAEAIRGYAALESAPPGEERTAAFRELTFRLLRSPDERLAAAALRDLVARAETLLTAESVPLIEPLIDDPDVAIGIRLGVLAELDRLGRIEGDLRWVRLLRTARGPDLLAVVRAARAHPGPGVNEELIGLLETADGEVALAAAIALGVRGNQPAVAPLAKVLEEGDRREQMAAIRALGAIAVPAAVAVLERAAGSHAEEDVRRRAAAEIRRLGGSGRGR